MKSSRSPVLHEAVAPTQFHSREPDNLLRVEQTSGGGVVICAAKTNFDSAQRRAFVLYLKAEGFIPKRAQLVAGDSKAGVVPTEGQILWVLDPCWPYTEVKFNFYSRRLCARLLFGPLLIWLFFHVVCGIALTRDDHAAPTITVAGHQQPYRAFTDLIHRS